jgi:hypothetical protein
MEGIFIFLIVAGILAVLLIAADAVVLYRGRDVSAPEPHAYMPST